MKTPLFSSLLFFFYFLQNMFCFFFFFFLPNHIPNPLSLYCFLRLLLPLFRTAALLSGTPDFILFYYLSL